MSKDTTINAFLAQRTLAVVGVSRGGKKFGNSVYHDLKNKGYRVFPVNPHAGSIAGERCFPDLLALPEHVGGAVLVIPPAETERIVRQAAEAGIKRVWIQQGAESEDALQFCESHGIDAVHGECIMMFSEPTKFPHKVHRWVRNLTRKH